MQTCPVVFDTIQFGGKKVLIFWSNMDIMEAVGSSFKTLLSFYQTTRCHIPEAIDFHNYHH
jgi:hypothetical protein